MKPSGIHKIAFVVLLLFGIVACEVSGELQEETQTVEIGDVESVEVKLDMGVGILRIRGGASELMEAEFAYSIKHWKPRIDYSVVGKRGVLEVKQGKSRGMTVGKKRNRWDISLNDRVPIELKIDFGVGQADFDMRGMSLQALDIDAGVGELTLDLTGERKQDLDVSLDGGVGSATIYLPEDIGVRVRVEGGLGSVNVWDMKKRGNVYVNDAYGKSDVAIDIDVDAGIGSIDLKIK